MRKNTVTGFLLALLLGAGFSAMAQTPEQRAEISRKYDHEKIAQLRDKLKQRHEENYNKALDLAKINGWPLRIVENGRVAVLSGVSYDNTPLYKTTDNNVDAATTARIPAVRSNGSLGLDVNGQDMIIGIWEIGEVRTSHVDLTGRVTVKDGAFFVAHDDETLHATHVAGTMIGSGTGNPNTLGLAYEAELWAYDSNNDTNEALNAAEDGLLVSNHSYGLRLNDNTQWMRGQYTQESEEWDEVLYEAPYYQAVISAGNDGNGNTYDLLLGNKTSKNAVIVAATHAVLNYNPNNPNAVDLASFTSFGPTDDRRIKPDIATDGWMLLSCSSESNTSYVTESGTSMSSPGVAASLTLMQQHYHDTFNEWMRASTVKALMINTADEIGPNAGPDAKTGWGLINVTKAVQLITASDNEAAIINEITLDSGGDDYVLPIQAHGDKPIKATIVWTDPAGAANNSGTPNNNIKLRNDLDIRIVKDDETFYPWVLNPFSVAQAAIKDDNVYDNVETIQIDNPVAGATYTITVSHKGFALYNLQDQVFSLVVDGADEDLGIAENTVDKVRIYPNPAHDIININLGSLTNGSEGSVTMYDLQGRLVKQYSSLVDKIDVSALTAGMYIINIENNGFKHSQKIIVE